MLATGDTVVLENLAAGRTSSAMPATVICLEPPTCFIPTGVDVLRLVRRQGGALPRVLPTDRLMSDEFVLSASTWGAGNVLYLAPISRPYAVHVRWAPTWEFQGWYVNLQRPMQLAADRWVTEDHFLDIVVQPDGRWEWKDDDELDAAVAVGRISGRTARGARSAARQVVSQIQRQQWPFDPSCAGWRPDPRWTHPAIPPSWRPTG